MPTIRLSREEAESGHLPLVCLCCGDTADGFYLIKFRESPAAAFLMYGLFWEAFLTDLFESEHIWVQTPLCSSHTDHWTWREKFLGRCNWLLLLLLVGPHALMRAGFFEDCASEVAFFSFLGLCLPWLIVRCVVTLTSVRGHHISPTGIDVMGASRSFVDAVRAQRDANIPLDPD